MTNREIEIRLQNIEKAISNLGRIVTNRCNDSESKENEIDGKTEVNSAGVKENASNIDVSNEALDALMEEVIPAQSASITDMEEALDTIMTTVIPSLMDGNAE